MGWLVALLPLGVVGQWCFIAWLIQGDLKRAAFAPSLHPKICGCDDCRRQRLNTVRLGRSLGNYPHLEHARDDELLAMLEEQDAVRHVAAVEGPRPKDGD